MMKKLNIIVSVFLLFVSCKGTDSIESVELSYVDPAIGGVSALLQPTRPTIQLPNQMIRLTPSRTDMANDVITDYPLNMTSHRLTSVFGFLPIKNNLDDVWKAYQICDNEVNRPYYYSADLDDCSLEFAPSAKSGIFRITYDVKDNNAVRLSTINRNGLYELVDSCTVTGIAEFDGMKAFLFAEFDKPILYSGYKNNSKRDILLNMGDDEQVMMRYGLSYIDINQAKENLRNEIPDFNFENVVNKGRHLWNEALGKIKVKGGTDEHKRVFYTSLYRCYERMVDINEYGRYYSAYDKNVHDSEEPFFVDNWIWDTHIALEPLQMILDPKKEEQKINSYIEMYKQCGRIPSFAVISGEWAAMTGNFSSVWMTDAWFKGLNFDLETAYEGLKKNSLDGTLIPWRKGPKTAIDDFYNEKGYYPALKPGEKETIAEVDTIWERRQAVSITTAYSYADWCLAQLAKELKKDDDYKLFIDRSANYKNVFNVEKGFMWPKDSDGNWIEPYDPRFADRKYFTENNAYIFNWDVKHDMKGLIDLMGGREAANRKLDQLYNTDLGLAKYEFFGILPDHTGNVGQFSMGNEPSFHIPYLYNYVGYPWKTQKRIHSLIDTFFSDEKIGLPGDEDGGGMSAFVVFSMMGFFPVTPGIPVYNIGSPFFEEVSIELPNNKFFKVNAKNFSERNKYVQSAEINGITLDKPWFSHKDIVDGGELVLVMGDKPNKEWGAKESDVPPSQIDYYLKR